MQILFSQNDTYKYYNQSYIQVPKTDSLYDNGHYRASVRYNLLRTDASGHRIPQANYNLAQNYALLRMPDSAFFYLNRYIDFGSQDYRSVYIDEDFESLKKHKAEWEKICDRIDEIYLWELDSAMNTDLALKLFHIGIEMDRIGLTSVSCRRKKPPTINAVIKQNLKTQRALKRIIKKNGLPTPSMVGETASGIAWEVIHHARIEDEYYYMIVEAFSKGDYNPQYFALTTDRWLVQNGKYQVYGTQFKKDKDGIFTLVRVDDFENVNKRRNQLGLCSIEEYAKLINGVIPKKYYEKKQDTDINRE